MLTLKYIMKSMKTRGWGISSRGKVSSDGGYGMPTPPRPKPKPKPKPDFIKEGEFKC